MKLVCLFVFLLFTLAGKANDNTAAYLKQVLSNLEKIESASYYQKSENWQPGDTVASSIYCRFINEYNNPKDTTIGVSFVSLECESQLLDFGYNGEIRALVYKDKQGIVVDDFTIERPLSFRPINPPFFNYTKSIIRYILTTNDSISLEQKETDTHFYLKLTIDENNQIEFFGKPYRIPDNSQYWGATTSIYELWINKEKDLPYKVRREMSHSISVRTCTEAVFNKLSIENFDLYSYFPDNYEIRKYKVRNRPTEKSPLLEKEAPPWSLKDKNEQSISLQDYKGKVLLIQFTGIGCGPCILSIPFLRTLKEKYDTAEFELLAIESWARKPHLLQNYARKHKLNYNILSATDEVLNNYQTGRAAPVFFILDKDQVVKKVVYGYKEGTAKEEIEKTIEGLLE